MCRLRGFGFMMIGSSHICRCGALLFVVHRLFFLFAAHTTGGHQQNEILVFLIFHPFPFVPFMGLGQGMAAQFAGSAMSQRTGGNGIAVLMLTGKRNGGFHGIIANLLRTVFNRNMAGNLCFGKLCVVPNFKYQSADIALQILGLSIGPNTVLLVVKILHGSVQIPGEGFINIFQQRGIKAVANTNAVTHQVLTQRDLEIYCLSGLGIYIRNGHWIPGSRAGHCQHNNHYNGNE